MKSFSRTGLVTIIMLGSLAQAQSPWVFSFKSSRPINGATFGYSLSNLLLFGGVDLLHVSNESERSSVYHNRDWNTDQLYRSSTSESSYNFKGTLTVPHAGLRYYFGSGETRAYLLGEAFVIVPSLTYESSGKSVDYNPDGSVAWTDTWDETLEDDDRDEAYDQIDFIGLIGGLGAEYQLSDGFSIGGEFGLRMMTNSASTDDDYTDEWDGTVYSKSHRESTIKAKIAGTYTSLVLNYRF